MSIGHIKREGKLSSAVRHLRHLGHIRHANNETRQLLVARKARITQSKRARKIEVYLEPIRASTMELFWENS